MAVNIKLTPEVLERALRMYRTAADIATALGVTQGSVNRACRNHGLTAPGGYKSNDPAKRIKPYSANADLGKAQKEADKVKALILEDRLRREGKNGEDPTHQRSVSNRGKK